MALSLHDGLNITEDSQRPFAIEFVTFDQSRKKGGEIIKLTNAVRVGAKHNQKANDTISVKQIGNSNHPYIVHTHLILSINEQQLFV
jgi:hypothetical protein